MLAEIGINIEIERRLHDHARGQGFPAPTYDDQFAVLDQRIAARRHSRLQLRRVGARASSGKTIDDILLGQTEIVPGRTEAAYQFALNFCSDSYTLELGIEHWRAALPAGVPFVL